MMVVVVGPVSSSLTKYLDLERTAQPHRGGDVARVMESNEMDTSDLEGGDFGWFKLAANNGTPRRQHKKKDGDATSRHAKQAIGDGGEK